MEAKPHSSEESVSQAERGREVVFDDGVRNQLQEQFPDFPSWAIARAQEGHRQATPAEFLRNVQWRMEVLVKDFPDVSKRELILAAMRPDPADLLTDPERRNQFLALQKRIIQDVHISEPHNLQAVEEQARAHAISLKKLFPKLTKEVIVQSIIASVTDPDKDDIPFAEDQLTKEQERQLLAKNMSPESQQIAQEERRVFLERLSRVAIDEAELDEAVKRLSIPSHESARHWKIFRLGEDRVSHDNLIYNKEMFRLREAIPDESAKNAFWNAVASEAQKAKHLIETALEQRKEQIYEAFNKKLSFSEENPSSQKCETQLSFLQKKLASYKAEQEIFSRFSRSEDNDPWWPDTVKVFREIMPDVVRLTEQKIQEMTELGAQAKEREVERAEEEKEKELLLQETERKLDYLKEIYSKGTKLPLPNPSSIADRQLTQRIGSVLTGATGVEMNIDVRLSMDMWVEDYLSLEMGDDLESIKKRMAMINWIAPHEIAHMVQKVSDVESRLLTEEGTASLVTLTEHWKGDHQDFAKKNLISCLAKETIVDSIGYRMVKEYGSADPADITLEQRIAAVLQGYGATVGAIEYSLKEQVTEEDPKMRYAIFLLRQIADGEILMEDAENNSVNETLLTEMEQNIKKVWSMFHELNGQIHLVEKSQIVEVINLCKYFFHKAEQVPLLAKHP